MSRLTQLWMMEYQNGWQRMRFGVIYRLIMYHHESIITNESI